jgi:hypothetical protein
MAFPGPDTDVDGKISVAELKNMGPPPGMTGTDMSNMDQGVAPPIGGRTEPPFFLLLF